MQKKLVVQRRNEVAYRGHLSTFKNTFLDFIYQSLDSSKLPNLVEEVEEAEYSQVVKET